MSVSRQLLSAAGYYARTRSRLGDESTETVEAYRKLGHARLIAYVSENLAKYPPMTPEQVDTVTRLLRHQADA
jgi:hypothetical protein